MAIVRDFQIVENYRPYRHVEAAVTEEDITRFTEDGYLHLPGALSVAQTAALTVAVERIAEAESSKAGGGGIFLRHLMDKDQAFLNLLEHPQFLPIARVMLGPMVRALPVTARIAVPGEENQAVEWHIHQRLVPNPMPPFFSQPVVIDTLIYLDDVDEETGPLQVLPGSHRMTQEALLDKSADQPGQVTLMPKAGDAIMTHGNVWHRALPTTPRGRRRRLIIFPFGPTWVNLPTFGARPINGLLEAMVDSTDPDMLELMGECERLY